MKYIEEVRLTAPQTPDGWRFIAGLSNQFEKEKTEIKLFDNYENIILEYKKEREVFFND